MSVTKPLQTLKVDKSAPNKSVFDLSYDFFSSGRFGQLGVVGCFETLPGDNFKIRSSSLARFRPLSVPIMADMNMRTSHYYVPTRLLMSNFDDFIVGRVAGNVPSVTMFELVKETFIKVLGLTLSYDSNQDKTILSGLTWSSNTSGHSVVFSNKQIASIKTYFDNLKISDLPICSYIISYLSGNNVLATHVYPIADYPTINDAYNDFSRFISNVFEYFFGGKSLISQLGYQFIDTFGNDTNESGISLSLKGASTSTYELFINNSAGYSSLNIDNKVLLSVLPLRAYYTIWYWNYRNKWLEQTDSFIVDPSSLAADNPSSISLLANHTVDLLFQRFRCWSGDLFTTALQEGLIKTPSVSPVNGGTDLESDNLNLQSYVQYLSSTSSLNADSLSVSVNSEGVYDSGVNIFTPSAPSLFLSQVNPYVTLDVENTEEFTIENLHRCEAIRKVAMKMLLTGDDRRAQLKALFGVDSLDERLRQPEFIGGSKQLVNTQTLTSNVTADGGSTMGDQAAVSVGFDNGDFIKKFTEEHGYIITLFSIIPKECAYTGLMSKHIMKRNMLDYAIPDYSSIGFDRILSNEVGNTVLTNSSDSGNLSFGVFGVHQRYYDYKVLPSRYLGDMLSDRRSYVFGRSFSSVKKNIPVLDYKFIHCHPNTDMFVIEDDDYDSNDPNLHFFYFNVRHDISAQRPLSFFSEFSSL